MLKAEAPTPALDVNDGPYTSDDWDEIEVESDPGDGDEEEGGGD